MTVLPRNLLQVSEGGSTGMSAFGDKQTFIRPITNLPMVGSHVRPAWATFSR